MTYEWKKTLNENRLNNDFALYNAEGDLVAHVYSPPECPTLIRTLTFRADGTSSHEDIMNEPIDEVKDLILVKAKMGAFR